MHTRLFYNENSKDPIYYAQQRIRNGAETAIRSIRKFGKHSGPLKITDDSLAYVKGELRKMNKEYRVGEVNFAISADFNERIKYSSGTISSSNWLNIRYFLLQAFLGKLRFQDSFREKTDGRRITLDCYTIHRFLICIRVLSPLSKYVMRHKLDSYYERLGFDYQRIPRFMDLLEENYDNYLAWLYRQSNTIVKEDTSILYYDRTDFYFECEQESKDIVDEVTGEVMKGPCQYGRCKEHRPNSIAKVDLFMDSQGIPVIMCLHPSNTSEQLIAVLLEKEVLNMLPDTKFIRCVDVELGSYNVRKLNSMGGGIFIVTQSVKKLSDTLKRAVFSDYGYRPLSDNSPTIIRDMKTFDRHEEDNLGLYNDHAYKVIAIDKVMDLGLHEDVALKNGRMVQRKAKGTLKQRIIITSSRKMTGYQRTVRSRQIERAKKLLSMKDPEEVEKGPNGVKRFMKRTSETKSGEKAEVEYIPNESRIAEEGKYDGHYVVATNLSNPTRDIFGVSRKGYQIKDRFRIMRTSFDDGSVSHRLPECIKAHFLICFTALLAYHLMEAKLDGQKTHVTVDGLTTTLRNVNVANIHDIEYTVLYNGSKVLDALMQLTLLLLDRIHYRPRKLNGIIKKALR